MKNKKKIAERFILDETTGRVLRSLKEMRKALKNGHQLRGIVTTKEGKRQRTSTIISVSRKKMETRNSLYILD